MIRGLRLVAAALLGTLALAAACGGESKRVARGDGPSEPRDAGTGMPDAGGAIPEGGAVPEGGTVSPDGGIGYHCRGTEQRIERERVCDGVEDCPAGDDEPCFKTPPACPRHAPVVEAWLGGNSVCGLRLFRSTDLDFSYTYICDSGGQIQPSLVCDAVPDCPAGDDEEGCPILCHPTCEADGRTCTYPPCEMPCADGSTALVSEVCDGRSDCPGGEDEECVDRFSCPFDTGFSVDFTQLCDGLADCSDAADERECPHAPAWTYFVCDDGEEILFPYFSRGCYGAPFPRQPKCSDGSAPYLPCPPI